MHLVRAGLVRSSTGPRRRGCLEGAGPGCGCRMVRDFLEWWVGQLVALLPRALRRSAAAFGDAMVLTPLAPLGRGVEAVAVGLRRNGKETPLGRCGLDAAALGRLPRPPGGAYVLRLTEADVLAKTLTLPLAAQADLPQVLAFEMDRETPFKADEIYWSHRIEAIRRDSGQLAVRLLLVTKASLAPLIAALGAAGIVPRRAEIADGPERAPIWRSTAMAATSPGPRAGCCGRRRHVAHCWHWLQSRCRSCANRWP